MKELLANMAVGVPALLFIIATIAGLHSVFGENLFPMVLVIALLLGAGALVGIAVRNMFSGTTVMYRLNRWIRK